MLYRTTRGHYDVVTAYKTVHTDCYVDGGLFLPLRMPQMDRGRLQAIATASVTQTIAQVLNELFSMELTAWDIESAIGLDPVCLAPVGRQVMAGQMWGSDRADIGDLVLALSKRIGGTEETPTNWLEIAVRIALLFGTYGLLRNGGGIHAHEKLDIAMAVCDFSMPIAACYARQMGLPVGKIICGCNVNGGVWDLLNRGELDTGERAVATLTPDCDRILPRNLERLIHSTLGVEATRRYLKCCSTGSPFFVSEEQLPLLNQGLFAAVISDDRVGAIIPGVYRSRGYILDPYTALAYGGVLDFRAMTGEERPTLLIADQSPVKEGKLVRKLLKIDDPKEK